MSLYAKPFRQMVEDVMKEMKEQSSQTSVIDKYKSRINYVYSTDLPVRATLDWMTAESTISLVADYATGTVAVENGGTAITLTDGTWAGLSSYSSSSSTLKIYISEDDELYDWYYTGATTGVISPAYLGADDATESSYVVFKNTYDCPEDFLRPVDEFGFFVKENGHDVTAKWNSDEQWHANVSRQPNDLPINYRIKPGRTSAGLQQVELSPPPDRARVLYTEYVKYMPNLVSFDADASACTTTAASTSATVTADITSKATAGRYFKVDSDTSSDWRKISSSAYASPTTTITLDSAYRVSNAGVETGFTISDAPDMPHNQTNILFLGGCWLTSTEQNDSSKNIYLIKYEKAISDAIAFENRKRYGSRRIGVAK